MSESNENFLSAAASSVMRRRRLLLGGLVLVALGGLGSTVWRASQGPLRSAVRFQITADSVTVSPPPPWVRVDIRRQAIGRARTQGPLTVIDPGQTTPRIAEAFRREPWVHKVDRVELAAPNRAHVELQWRRPLAAVELTLPSGVVLCPLDHESVRLPSQGLHDAELRRLPRITRISGIPPEGEAWIDPQVNGAVALIAALADNWDRLSLADVVPSRLPEIRGERQFYQFELLTSGGTHIYWGAAPGVSTDEPAFAAKLATLQQHVAQHNWRLDGYPSPKTIDLRRGFDATKRIAKEEGESRTALAPAGEAEEVVK